ncbi:MAG: hypothetical protein GY830_05885 [Bacteroidetes bacterium]|nr:hypothetical protein [Bacteroidota bacterium]
MKPFNNYLENKKLVKKSIKRIIQIAQKYLSWLKSKNLEIEDSSYSDLMNYIGYLQNQDLKTATINDYIRCIGHYYDFKKLNNVTIGVRLLGETRVKYLLFTEEKLDKIYSDYLNHNTIKKIILGLIIYQGLDRNEIFKLKIDDLDLEHGKISIGFSHRKNERFLDLKSYQILLTYDYTKQNELKNNLFPFYCKDNRIRKLLDELLKEIKKINNDIINLRQLKYSCYAIWIKKFGIRKAQYFAGFKKASSIQKYKDQDLESLKGDIVKFHPLN